MPGKKLKNHNFRFWFIYLERNRNEN